MPPITQTLAANQDFHTPSTSDTDDIPWAQARLRPDQAWQHANGAGVTVAVVDTGVDAGQGAQPVAVAVEGTRDHLGLADEPCGLRPHFSIGRYERSVVDDTRELRGVREFTC
ncbi:hypothetical protein ACWEV3_09395 [Saccharopolyspora sp. NPDC003752]